MGLREAKSILPPGSYYLSGNEAAAEGAIAARCSYYAGYPITPSTEIAERISVRFKEVGGVFMQMEDELSSICSAVGAVWAGAKAMLATSGPGFSLMQEGIGYAAMTETPIVIVDVQRPGPSTGQATTVAAGDVMQAKWGSHGDYQVIALSPWSVQEMYEQTINGFNFAERYRVPVIVLSEAALGHLRERMDVREKVQLFDRVKKAGAAPFGTEEDDGVPPMPSFGEGQKLLVTGSTHNDYGVRKTDDPRVHEKLTSRLHNKIMNNREEIIEYEDYYLADAEIAVVCYGLTSRSSLFAIQRMQQEGKKVGMLRLKTLWPFADRLVSDIGTKVKKIFVPEMNKGQIVGEVMKYASCDIIPYNQTNGQIIQPNVIMAELETLLQ